ncbi:DUF6602 domain-containing protein [Pedobacter sp. JY14-1]|uniref:DUF6602 domain-containing protein n=1 Tax=Pedobacter sp. JY14-1 TaxID=3034151 RepID=UPI0023E1F1F3|nr:DUF6602 domain-containing protein [Pedobacter sp. JY14-1]
MNLTEFHKSTSKELLAVTNRVKNLVQHWPEVGRHKEAVLKNIIKKFLPEKYNISTGFVVRQTEERGQHLASRQIDLIIYDSDSPLLFREGDFAILTADVVRGIIEVKANLQQASLHDTVLRANENGHFIFSAKDEDDDGFFNGIFSFEGFRDPNPITIANAVVNANAIVTELAGYSKFKVNHISFNSDLFLKYWPDEAQPHSLYNLSELSFSFFISNLVDMLASKSVRKNNFIWFSTDKELNLMHTF